MEVVSFTYLCNASNSHHMMGKLLVSTKMEPFVSLCNTPIPFKDSQNECRKYKTSLIIHKITYYAYSENIIMNMVTALINYIKFFSDSLVV